MDASCRLVSTMVHKCAAYNCRSGYKGDGTENNVSFHGFPLNNKELCDKWLKANPRKDIDSGLLPGPLQTARPTLVHALQQL